MSKVKGIIKQINFNVGGPTEILLEIPSTEITSWLVHSNQVLEIELPNGEVTSAVPKRGEKKSSIWRMLRVVEEEVLER